MERITALLLATVTFFGQPCAGRLAWLIEPVQRNHFDRLAPRNLTTAGKEVLIWLEDAESCFPMGQDEEMAARKRIFISDMLHCCQVERTSDICEAASEYARRHPRSAEAILHYLQPLVFPHVDNVEKFRLAPWIVQNNVLLLDQRWQTALINRGGTGRPAHYSILEIPPPKADRTYIIGFEQQIVKERSHWKLPGDSFFNSGIQQ